MDIATWSLISTIALAFIGYLVTYWNNVQTTKNQAQLDLINKRIAEFYGPLYIATQANERAYKALLQKLGKKAVFDDANHPATKEDIEEWRIWLVNVFTPINLNIEKLINERAYLIQEEEIPECLLTFVTHISGYKALLGKWEKGDYSENVSVIKFPRELSTYSSQSYKELKIKQLRLIGKTTRRIKIEEKHSI